MEDRRQDVLFLKVRDKDAAALREWLEGEGRGVDVNPRNDEAQTPLYWACEVDDPELVQVRGAGLPSPPPAPHMHPVAD